ncbi:MAG: YcgN family cysteine cluster protein [Chromatiaceae bacterium]|nr:YcgN family cysteine cluster protein [Gammaproteobacteria bacterium]MCP5427746.1 YcgN family cysteine cluster protein [Chromatiaceae bacterium]MCB1861518.1 YcgN family cysteine cluster protein [Gammaproteobacteria bacterium]MCB1873207.1 YcgN family cysteine cluster protein [Gammaproteobacteria bacterium]MCB1881282.1 YcgN family cysteine cluster protein [Gammaproteobacteria bacterium]
MPDCDNEFWKTVPLQAMNKTQWEALCDRCAKCCLHRFEERKTRQIQFTNVCCRYLDRESGDCRDYPNRSRNVPDCVRVTLAVLEDPYWLPESCAYRLLAERKALPQWHPLVSGDPHTVVSSGNFVGGWAVCELETDNLEHHLIDWVR